MFKTLIYFRYDNQQWTNESNKTILSSKIYLGLAMKKENELYEIIYLLNPSFTQQEISSKIEE